MEATGWGRPVPTPSHDAIKNCRKRNGSPDLVEPTLGRHSAGITRETLLGIDNGRPFQPYSLRLDNGDVVRVEQAEHCLVTEDGRTLVFNESGQAQVHRDCQCRRAEGEERDQRSERAGSASMNHGATRLALTQPAFRPAPLADASSAGAARNIVPEPGGPGVPMSGQLGNRY